MPRQETPSEMCTVEIFEHNCILLNEEATDLLVASICLKFKKIKLVSKLLYSDFILKRTHRRHHRNVSCSR